jgi:hypothetical protein
MRGVPESDTAESAWRVINVSKNFQLLAVSVVLSTAAGRRAATAECYLVKRSELKAGGAHLPNIHPSKEDHKKDGHDDLQSSRINCSASYDGILERMENRTFHYARLEMTDSKIDVVNSEMMNKKL